MNHNFRLYGYLHMGSNMGVAVSGMAGHLGRLNRLVDQTTGKLTALGRAGAAAIGVLASAKMSEGLWDAVRAGGELLNIQNRLRTQGWSAGQVSRATTNATRVQGQVGNVSNSEVMSIQGQLMALFNDDATVRAIAPTVARLQSTIRAAGGNDAGMDKLLKAIEMRGHIYSTDAQGRQYVDPAKFAAEIDAAYRAINSSGGMLKPEDIYQLVARGGMLSQSMGRDAFYGIASELASSTSGSSAGTQMMAMGQQFLFGIMKKELIGPLSQLGYRFDGRRRLQGDDQTRLRDNPFEFLADMNARVRKRTRRNAGENDETYERRVAMETAGLMGRATGQRMSLDVIQNALQYANNLRRFRASMGLEQAHRQFRDEDLNMAVQSIGKTWTSLTEALGVGVAKDFAWIINRVTDGLSAINVWVASHPNATRNLMRFAAGFAGVMTLLSGAVLVGGIVIAATAFSGLLTAAAAAAAPVIAIAGGIAALGVLAMRTDWKVVGVKLLLVYDQLAYLVTGVGTLLGRIGGWAWEKLRAAGTSISEALGELWGGVSSLWTQLGNTWIGGLAGQVTGWLGQITSSFVTWITDLWNKVKEYIPGLPSAPTRLTPNEQREQNGATGTYTPRGGSLNRRTQEMFREESSLGGPTLASNVLDVPRSTQVIEVHQTTTLDGRVLTRTVTEYQTAEARRYARSGGSFDSRMNPIPTGGALA
jgi:hypothetical protein